MDMRAALVLPLKPQPVVGGLKDFDIQGLEELHDTVVKEPVSKDWVLDDGLGTNYSGVRIVRTNKAGKLWPLEVCHTVSEENGG